MSGPIFTGAAGLLVILTHCALSYFLSEWAGRLFGRPSFWFLCFLLLPLVSHGLFLYLLVDRHRKLRLLSRQKNLFDLSLRANYLNEQARREQLTDKPVTPFGSLPDLPRDAGGSDLPTILKEWHDRGIDELIEWKQWKKALESADRKLKAARAAGDNRSIELYKAYLDVIRLKTHS